MWRPTSRIRQALTWAASTSLMPSIPSQFASTKKICGFPDRLRLVQSHPMQTCLESLVVGARISNSLTCGSVNVPGRRAHSKCMWTTLRKSLKDRLSSWARTCRGGKASSHDHRRTLGPYVKDSHSEKDSWTSKIFYMSMVISAGPVISSRGSKLVTCHHETP